MVSYITDFLNSNPHESIAIVISVVSLISSFGLTIHANTKAKKANEIANNANKLAEEANGKADKANEIAKRTGYAEYYNHLHIINKNLLSV